MYVHPSNNAKKVCFTEMNQHVFKSFFNLVAIDQMYSVNIEQIKLSFLELDHYYHKQIIKILVYKK